MPWPLINARHFTYTSVSTSSPSVWTTRTSPAPLLTPGHVTLATLHLSLFALISVTPASTGLPGRKTSKGCVCGTSVIKCNDKIVYYSPKQDILRHFSVERNIFSAYFLEFQTCIQWNIIISILGNLCSENIFSYKYFLHEKYSDKHTWRCTLNLSTGFW